jgi:hypothetical protein
LRDDLLQRPLRIGQAFLLAKEIRLPFRRDHLSMGLDARVDPLLDLPCRRVEVALQRACDLEPPVLQSALEDLLEDRPIDLGAESPRKRSKMLLDSGVVTHHEILPHEPRPEACARTSRHSPYSRSEVPH